jgi:hypothetical protein
MRIRYLIVFLLVSGAVPAQEERSTGHENSVIQEVQGVVIMATPRTPEQMAAFYEARGFPHTMLDIVKEQCFITFRIRNTSRNIVWLDLAHWGFTGPRGEIERLDRNWWKSRWKEIDAPMASQSTFRWTLIPEQLDYRFDEVEGGNVTLVRTGDPFTLDAVFPTGADREGEAIRVRMNDLLCPDDTQL